jgi:hypothetical protein
MANFQDYLKPDHHGMAENHTRFRRAFAEQRENIARVAAALHPSTVVCFGAGMLNDIPLEAFLRWGAEVHLVDWMEGVLEFGLAAAIVTNTRTGPDCVFCTLDEAQASAYCGSFSEKQPGAGVCTAYDPTRNTTPGCDSYERGSQPHLHTQDVTGGFARAFGDGAQGILAGVDSWRQAFRRGQALSRKAKESVEPLDLADGSIDFITASMLISQFEAEPYRYFSKLAVDTLGTPSAADEKRLKGAGGLAIGPVNHPDRSVRAGD